MRAARERLLSGSEIARLPQGEIEYAVRGEGVPVLLLHGAGGGFDQGLWSGKVTLGDGYRLVSVSRYGFLRSPIPDGASVKTQAALYRDLLDYLRIERAIVIGSSAGGPSATQFANDYPERCSALILLSAVSLARAPGDKDPFYVNIIHLIQQSDYVYWLFTRFLQPVFLSLLGIPSGVYEGFTPGQRELSQEMLDIMHPMTPRHKGTINDGEMLELGIASTGNIASPTLIIHARDDALVSFTHAESAHRRIAGSKLMAFDTGGHAMLSQMEGVRKHVSEFLRNIARVAPVRH